MELRPKDIGGLHAAESRSFSEEIFFALEIPPSDGTATALTDAFLNHVNPEDCVLGEYSLGGGRQIFSTTQDLLPVTTVLTETGFYRLSTRERIRYLRVLSNPPKSGMIGEDLFISLRGSDFQIRNNVDGSRLPDYHDWLDSIAKEATLPPSEVNRRNSVKKQYFTQRQEEVLHLIQEGRSNKEIAEKLVITESTVKTQISALMEIAGVHDRTNLAIKYLDKI
jgi:DNA-binding CsgD family transcriptional regulator